MYIYQKYIYFNTKYNLPEDKKKMSLNFTLPYIKKKTFHARPVNFNEQIPSATNCQPTTQNSTSLACSFLFQL